jgi:hypothetical protein
VDGVGLGEDDPKRNPLASIEFGALTAFAGGRRLVQPRDRPVAADDRTSGLPGVDATLGVTGLPQSATGQTALFTGRNAAQHLGRHLGPYPNAELKALLTSDSLWATLRAAGASAALANAYPDRYLERARTGSGRMGAIARGAHTAGVRLRGPEDLRAGRAVSAFVTNQGWRERLGYDGPLVTPEDAGRVLAGVARDHLLTVFEFYATDVAGHRRDFAAAVSWLQMLDRMVGAARGELGARDVIVVVSDHGNVEDMDTRRHTLNPALALWSGPPPARPLETLTDVAPAILEVLGVTGPTP